MFKTIFVLVIATHGGINTDLHFTTLQQCESVKTLLKENTSPKAYFNGMNCIEMQVPVPIKKKRCKISNEFARATGNFYPVALECEEK